MLQQDLEAWRTRVVGRTSTVALGRVDALWAQRYAVAVDDLNPLYFDEDYARTEGYSGLIAPPNYLATLRVTPIAGPVEGELLTDGTAPDSRPAIPGLQIMGGGQTLEFSTVVYCGEEIFAEKRIESIEIKETRNGPLVIVEELINYFNGAKELKLTLRNRSLYREIPEERKSDT